jgi:hypothetical protein
MSETKETPVNAELLKELIQELKKPAPPTEEELATREEKKRKVQQEQEKRRRMATKHASILEAKKMQQKTCTHLRRDGTSRAVYVKHGNYLICQKCNVLIRPTEDQKNKSNINTIYDTNLFNRLFQMSVTSNVFD